MSTGGTTTASERLPLAALIVVALGQAVAGPLATRHLADLGGPRDHDRGA